MREHHVQQPDGNTLAGAVPSLNLVGDSTHLGHPSRQSQEVMMSLILSQRRHTTVQAVLRGEVARHLTTEPSAAIPPERALAVLTAP